MERGLSPVLSTFVLVFVVVIVSMAALSFVLGLWEKFGDVEAVKVIERESELRVERGGEAVVVRVLLKNEGTLDVKVIKVAIEGVGSCKVSEVVERGKLGEVSCKISEVNAMAGALYTVTLMTESGSLYKLFLEAREAES